MSVRLVIITCRPLIVALIDRRIEPTSTVKLYASDGALFGTIAANYLAYAVLDGDEFISVIDPGGSEALLKLSAVHTITMCPSS